MAEIYALLAAYLTRQIGEELALAFPTIESILGQPLPDAAWESTAWWTDAEQRVVWQEAGWQVAAVNLVAKVVTLRRLPTPSH